jgi:hypothetical protein
MVRLRIREVVKYGHWKEYKAACAAWNEAAVPLGLPPFRYFSSNWGAQNEMFAESEFEDSSDIERRFAAANAANNPKYEAAEVAVHEHVVEGQSYSWILSEESLD